MGRRSPIHALMMLTILGATAGVAEDDPCGRWGGVVDESRELSLRHEFKRMQKLFCSATDHVQSAHEATSAAGEAGIPLPIAEEILSLRVGGDFGTSSSAFDEWHQKFCSMDAREASTIANLERFTREFGTNAKDAALACYDSKRAGLHGKITPSRNGTVVTISVRYHALGSEVAKLSKAVRLTPAEAVTGCDPNNLFGKSKTISSEVVDCEWKSEKDIAVSVVTDHGSLSLSLDADPPPVPPKAGDRLQAGYAFLQPGMAPCSDPDNSDRVECPWWHTVIQPRSTHSKVRFSAVLTSTIAVAPCPCRGGCPNDPWRRGRISLRCGSSEESSKGSGENLTKDLRSVSESFSVSVTCDGGLFPVQLTMVASPRGCSAMQVRDGMVTYEEVQQ